MISDRFGRKWPLVANLLICAVLQLGAGFCKDFHSFLAVRSLFGVAMGGIWGLAVSTALENLPVEIRGIASGIVQEGYAVGYLIAAVINLYLVPTVSVGWRALFFTAAGISAFAAFVRALLPESELFLKAKAIERARGATTNKTRVFIHETGRMLKAHWKLCIYAVILMSGMCPSLFRFLSYHSSGRDLEPCGLLCMPSPYLSLPRASISSGLVDDADADVLMHFCSTHATFFLVT
jgi:MFS transporter, SHS family, lactate transporter